MKVQQSLFSEIERIIESDSLEKRAAILRLLIDLFLVGAEAYSDKQIDEFSEFFSRLPELIDTETRVEIAKRIASVKNAPAALVRALARDPAFEVAAPILTQSTQLTEEDLLACANGKSQEWLLAISRRASLSEAISELLVTQGNEEVVRSVAKNTGARLSSAGFGKLVEKSKNDEPLAVSVGSRNDIPQKYISNLGCNASEAVFKKIVQAAARAREAESKRDFGPAKALYESILQPGKPVEPIIYDFARSGKFEETIVALSVLCQLPIETVGNIMVDKRINNDLPLILAKRGGLPWLTAKLILELRCGEAGISPEEIETARQYFDQLQASTVQRVVYYYQLRHATNQKQIRSTP